MAGTLDLRHLDGIHRNRLTLSRNRAGAEPPGRGLLAWTRHLYGSLLPGSTRGGGSSASALLSMPALALLQRYIERDPIDGTGL
jgi:hypothetical protein